MARANSSVVTLPDGGTAVGLTAFHPFPAAVDRLVAEDDWQPTEAVHLDTRFLADIAKILNGGKVLRPPQVTLKIRRPAPNRFRVVQVSTRRCPSFRAELVEFQPSAR